MNCLAHQHQAGRSGRSGTRSALSDGGASCGAHASGMTCLGRSSRATPSSTPGSRIAALPGPRPIRTRSFGIERSGMCSSTSVRVSCPTSVRSTASMPCRRRSRRPVSSGSTRTATPWTPGPLADLSKSVPMPSWSSSGRTAKSWGSNAVVHWALTNGASMDDLRARQGHLRPVALHSGSGSQARRPPECRPLQGLGPAAIDQARAAQALQGAEGRPADGPDPEHDPHRWTGCGGCCLCRCPERRGPRGLGRHQHPCTASGAATATDHRYAGRVTLEACLRHDATDLRARRRLQTLR